MSESLRLRFFVPFLLLIAAVIGSLSYYTATLARKAILRTEEINLFNGARLAALQLEPFIIDVSKADLLSPAASQIAGLVKARVSVIQTNGLVVADTEQDPSLMENHRDRPEVKAALAGDEGSAVRRSATLGVDMLYAAVPVRQNDRVMAVVRLAILLTTAQEDAADIQRATLTAAFLASMAAAFLTWFISSFSLAPLRALTASVQKVQHNELENLPSSPRHDEIGSLQEAFREMAVRNQSQIADLTEEREKINAVLENMNDGIMIVDSDCAIQMINPSAAKLFTADREKALGLTLVEVTRNHQLMEAWQKSINTGEQRSITFETTIDRLSLQATAIPLSRMLPGYTLFVFQDLTRLRRLETVRRDFVSNVSHELRTPLASLRALAETLREGAIDDREAAPRFLSRMETEIDTLTQMVQELLELSKIESGRVPLEKQSVAPRQLLKLAFDRMQLQAERAGLHIELNCPEDLPEVQVDRERLTQVLVNLLHNAIKFTQPGGRINTSARYEEGKVIFQISDTGVGIESDALPRIFERFYKADKARSGGGTGLGLSIARHLVEAHGGTISAESEPGQGSTFSFSLPTEG